MDEAGGGFPKRTLILIILILLIALVSETKSKSKIKITKPTYQNETRRDPRGPSVDTRPPWT
jgi:hypothetical protein